MLTAERVSPEVLYSRMPYPAVTPEDIEELKAIARTNPRRRVRLCTHSSEKDTLHEMLIVQSRDNYIRPHRHDVKTESYHFIEGSAVVFILDEAGEVVAQTRLGTSGALYYRVPAGLYHCFVFTSDWAIFHESTVGPFNPAETFFAPWSPVEGDDDAVEKFLSRLRKATV